MVIGGEERGVPDAFLHKSSNTAGKDILRRRYCERKVGDHLDESVLDSDWEQTTSVGITDDIGIHWVPLNVLAFDQTVDAFPEIRLIHIPLCHLLEHLLL